MKWCIKTTTNIIKKTNFSVYQQQAVEVFVNFLKYFQKFPCDRHPFFWVRCTCLEKFSQHTGGIPSNWSSLISINFSYRLSTNKECKHNNSNHFRYKSNKCFNIQMLSIEHSTSVPACSVNFSRVLFNQDLVHLTIQYNKGTCSHKDLINLLLNAL